MNAAHEVANSLATRPLILVRHLEYGNYCIFVPLVLRATENLDKAEGKGWVAMYSMATIYRFHCNIEHQALSSYSDTGICCMLKQNLRI